MKIIDGKRAAELIEDKMTIGVGGFGGWPGPDDILDNISKRYRLSGSPRDLTIVSGITPGALKNDDWGVSRIRDKGIIKSIIAAHIGMPPSIGKAVGKNEIEGYTIPLGVLTDVLRATASNKPGVVTRIGLNTFADPRIEGCKMNEKAKSSGRELVKLISIDDEEFLFYNSIKLDACILRGTYSDEDGYISLDEEPLIENQLEMAQAAHCSGGIVIVQVKEIVKRGNLDAKRIIIPGSIVDYVVKGSSEMHVQGYDYPGLFRKEILGMHQIPVETLPPMELSARKIIGRRGAMELKADSLINLGIGMPDGVANVAGEEGIADKTTLAIESGVVGGVPVSGVGLGASVNARAILHVADNFDLYDGGALDMTFLGAAEIDKDGNVNVSRFGDRCVGPGGFIDISQSTKNVFFMGTFTAGKMEYQIENGKLTITKDGSEIKFRNKVDQITFSSKFALKTNQNVKYITERAVFKLTGDGLELVEIAPGVDLEKDILSKMEFKPLISKDLKLMDERIFCKSKMNLKIK